MAKISVSRLFEAGAVLEAFQKAKIEGIEGFITYLSDFSEQVIRGLRGNLSIEENLRSQIREVQLSSGVAQSMALDKGQTAVHVIVSKATPFVTELLSFNWEMQIDGTLSVRATWAIPVSPNKVTLKIIILF